MLAVGPRIRDIWQENFKNYRVPLLDVFLTFHKIRHIRVGIDHNIMPYTKH